MSFVKKSMGSSNKQHGMAGKMRKGRIPWTDTAEGNAKVITKRQHKIIKYMKMISRIVVKSFK